VNGFWVLLKRELRSITREKTIMFAILVQFFLASFSSIILVGIMAFYDPSSIGDSTRVTIRAGVVGDIDSPMVGYLREANVPVQPFTDVGSAESAFRSGTVDTIMVIPEKRSGVVDMKLILPEMDARKTVIFMVLDEPLKRFENELRAGNGVELHYNDAGGKPHTTHEFLYSIIIPVLMLFPALIAGSIVIDTVSEELENKTFDTLMSSPVSLTQVFASKVAAAVVTALVQVVMWSGLLWLNHLYIQNLGLVLLLAVTIAAAFSVGTAGIALYFRDRERAQFVYSIVLVLAVGGSYFLNPSPFSLITRLAAGDPNLGAPHVALYIVPLIVMGFFFGSLVKRLVLTR